MSFNKPFKLDNRINSNIVDVKSKFDAEFRRFSIDKDVSKEFEGFHALVSQLHFLSDVPFIITYIDPIHHDHLPINNDDNYQKALSTARPLLRLIIHKKAENLAVTTGYGSVHTKKNPIISKLRSGGEVPLRTRPPISMPEDFRQVSSIIDIDIVPETHRRVKLMKNGGDKPLGFYIRDGQSLRKTPDGKVTKVPSIFISRLIPGGLAESTGLLAVNDEVIEVNGIEVSDKSLDQVTDMMIANSFNLIITVKPKDQCHTLAPVAGGTPRGSNASQPSIRSTATSDVVIEHRIRNDTDNASDQGEITDRLLDDNDRTDEDLDEVIDVSAGATEASISKNDSEPLITF